MIKFSKDYNGLFYFSYLWSDIEFILSFLLQIIVMESDIDNGLLMRPGLGGEYLDLFPKLDINDYPLKHYDTCDYCRKSYEISDLKVKTQAELHYSIDSSWLSGAYIKQSATYKKTIICKRCAKIHKIADIFHVSLAIILMGLFVYYKYNNRHSDIFNDFVLPISYIIILVYIINIFDWLFIKLFLGVRRRAK